MPKESYPGGSPSYWAEYGKILDKATKTKEPLCTECGEPKGESNSEEMCALCYRANCNCIEHLVHEEDGFRCEECGTIYLPL